MLPKPYFDKEIELSKYLWKLEGYRAMSLKFINRHAPQLPDLFKPHSVSREPERHRMPMNSQTKEFLCPDCEHVFSSMQGLNRHIGKVHQDGNKNLPCPECDKTFKHKYAIKFHIAQVHQKTTRVSCSLCDKAFYNKYELRKHTDKHHGSDLIDT